MFSTNDICVGEMYVYRSDEWICDTLIVLRTEPDLAVMYESFEMSSAEFLFGEDAENILMSFTTQKFGVEHFTLNANEM